MYASIISMDFASFGSGASSNMSMRFAKRLCVKQQDACYDILKNAVSTGTTGGANLDNSVVIDMLSKMI